MSKVQGPDEGDQGPHLPPAAKVEMSEVRQSQDAEAKGEVRLVIRADSLTAPGRLWNGPHLCHQRSVAYR
jgi:hypothetical protein